MIEEKDIKLFHETNLDREVLPSGYELYRTNKIKTHPDHFIHASLSPTGHIPRYLENQYIFSNPKHDYYKIPPKNKKLKKNEKYQFKFNNVINIEKNKLMTYFLCNDYEKFFELFEFYMINLFNGLNLELIAGLFQRELISDSIYINAMKCIKIINDNKQIYKHTYIRNNINRLDTTEIFLKVEEIKKMNLKEDALLLLVKFSDLLKSIDENLFLNDINKLKEIFEKNNH